MIGLSVVGAAGLAAASRARLALATAAEDRRPDEHLVLNYRPSQPTGWPKGPQDTTVGMTIGGHTPSLSFTRAGTQHSIRLISFGQTASAPDPVYEALPSEPTINFAQALASMFDAHYSFRYEGSSQDWGRFSVQSYSVFVQQPSQASPAMGYGADLYVVLLPGSRLHDPAVRGSLQWIQVVRNQVATFVDASGRANPFYLSGGLTSINGTRVVNFMDSPQAAAFPGSTGPLPALFMAELFLAEDTGVKDRAGKDIVNIFGGLKYGWQLTTP